MTPEQREPVAIVKVSVDGPEAEDIWVSCEYVYEGESVADSLQRLSKDILDNLATGALRLYRERKRYGQGR